MSLGVQREEKREQEVKEQLARVVEDLGRVEKLCQQEKVYGEAVQKERSKLYGGK